MITLIEALNFRCLRDISRPMDRFHVLVGPNASGKSTFLDVVGFLSDLVREGLDRAISRRSPTFHDLLFRHEGDRFELAIEAAIPGDLRQSVVDHQYDRIRFEVVIRFDESAQEYRIDQEVLRVLSPGTESESRERLLFPETRPPRPTLVMPSARKELARKVLTRTATGRANYYSETYKETGKGWNPQWDLPLQIAALANLPADEAKFPVATWFRGFLSQSIAAIQLDSQAMRHPSPPGQGLQFKRDGSNLPWVINAFQTRQPERFREWIEHLKTTLTDVEDIRSVEREEDRHRYLKVCYAGDLEVPSWLVSDGTLRLLALTLPAYLDNLEGVLLIEEPENGIHPRAVETLYESLSNVYNAQVLLATHSPVVLSNVAPEQVLCFAKSEAGAADIVSGDQHPNLADWQREVSLGTLFAAGVLS
jgi:predicted ATPase